MLICGICPAGLLWKCYEFPMPDIRFPYQTAAISLAKLRISPKQRNTLYVNRIRLR